MNSSENEYTQIKNFKVVLMHAGLKSQVKCCKKNKK